MLRKHHTPETIFTDIVFLASQQIGRLCSAPSTTHSSRQASVRAETLTPSIGSLEIRTHHHPSSPPRRKGPKAYRGRCHPLARTVDCAQRRSPRERASRLAAARAQLRVSPEAKNASGGASRRRPPATRRAVGAASWAARRCGRPLTRAASCGRRRSPRGRAPQRAKARKPPRASPASSHRFWSSDAQMTSCRAPRGRGGPKAARRRSHRPTRAAGCA